MPGRVIINPSTIYSCSGPQCYRGLFNGVKVRERELRKLIDPKYRLILMLCPDVGETKARSKSQIWKCIWHRSYLIYAHAAAKTARADKTDQIKEWVLPKNQNLPVSSSAEVV